MGDLIPASVLHLLLGQLIFGITLIGSGSHWIACTFTVAAALGAALFDVRYPDRGEWSLFWWTVLGAGIIGCYSLFLGGLG